MRGEPKLGRHHNRHRACQGALATKKMLQDNRVTIIIDNNMHNQPKIDVRSLGDKQVDEIACDITMLRHMAINIGHWGLFADTLECILTHITDTLRA
jgi:hypothetical protein